MIHMYILYIEIHKHKFMHGVQGKCVENSKIIYREGKCIVCISPQAPKFFSTSRKQTAIYAI